MEGTGYSCPACKATTGEVNEIMAGGHRLVCSKIAQHEWNDVEAFEALRPTMDFQKERPKPSPQQGHHRLQVSIPIGTLNKLQAKYGDRMDSTITASLNGLAEGDGFTISAVGMERMMQALPEKPRNADHLFGMIYALGEQAREAKQVAEAAQQEVRAYEGMSPGKIMVDLGESTAVVRQKAQDDNLPAKVWLERKCVEAIQNGWW